MGSAYSVLRTTLNGYRRAVASAALATVLVAGLGWPGTVGAVEVGAEPGRGPTVQPGTAPLLRGSDLVLRIQKELAARGLFQGLLDGRMGPQTRAAIRRFQRRNGLEETGEATETLAERLEMNGQVGRLLQRLDQARRHHTRQARDALLSSPATRHLLENRPEGPPPAPAPLDRAACFLGPTPACLLADAVAAAAEIDRDEHRDWALGEILVAQAKAGLTKEAMGTVARIHDTRLILVALRRIAEAQAQAGRFDDAVEAASLVPDAQQRLEALAAVAEIEDGTAPRSLDIARRVVAEAPGAGEPLEGLGLMARMAVLLHEGGDMDGAATALDGGRTLLAGMSAEARVPALRLLAEALARTGRSSEALAMAEDLQDAGERATVQVAAATAALDRGALDEARDTAAGIEAPRYRVVMLARIAAALDAAGRDSDAETALAAAGIALAAVELPYARDYGRAQLADALVRMGRWRDAGDIARAIEDVRLRAETLWAITTGTGAGAAEAKALAGLRATAEAASAAVPTTLGRVWMFTELALRSRRAGDEPAVRDFLGRALSVCETIAHPWVRARALAKVADALAGAP